MISLADAGNELEKLEIAIERLHELYALLEPECTSSEQHANEHFTESQPTTRRA